jgi:hypothetical protein
MTFVSKIINPQHVINNVSTKLGVPLPTAARLYQQVTCFISEYNDTYHKFNNFILNAVMIYKIKSYYK